MIQWHYPIMYEDQFSDEFQILDKELSCGGGYHRDSALINNSHPGVCAIKIRLYSYQDSRKQKELFETAALKCRYKALGCGSLDGNEKVLKISPGAFPRILAEIVTTVSSLPKSYFQLSVWSCAKYVQGISNNKAPGLGSNPDTALKLAVKIAPTFPLTSSTRA